MTHMIKNIKQKLMPKLRIKSFFGWLKNVVSPGEGFLPWAVILKLSLRNLRYSFSRSAVTIGAIASGAAAIVFLVGFAYGLQGLVTDRLIMPNTLRLTDV